MTGQSPPVDEIEHYLKRAERLAATVDDGPAKLPVRPVERVGIVGAGTMGGGIAMTFAAAGIPVRLLEKDGAALERGISTMRGHWSRSVERGRLAPAEMEARLGRIAPSLDWASLGDCDLLIEAAFERMALKHEIFGCLDAVAKSGAVLASNTSGLDLDGIAAATTRPADVIGLHFFSPAPVMRLLEIVRGARTDPAVVATALAVAERIGKIAVVVGVGPGFVANRMLYPRQIRARALLADGIMPWDVDQALREFGFRIGPFAMADLAGLDIGWMPGSTTEDPLRDLLCEAGRRGQKNRAGWYDYDDRMTPRRSPFTEQLLRDRFGATTGAETPPDHGRIVESCLFPLVNEGARILGEGKARRPSDIDLVWVHGFNWPRGTGGPMRWADGIGLARIATHAERLGRSDPVFAPAPLLRELASSGRRFADL